MANEWEVVASGEALGDVPPIGVPAQPAAEALAPGAGASFTERMMASFKSSPESERNFYAAKYGEENARLSRDNEVEIRDPASGKWRRADPSGLDIGDIADVAGVLPEMIGGAAGAIIGARGGPMGMLLGAGGGSLGGNVLKQAASRAFIPGKETESTLQRIGEAGLAGAMGLMGEGVGQVIQRGVIKPAAQALYRRALAGNAPAATEAQAIERAVARGAAPGTPGFQFTPGEATGGRAIQMAEDAARNTLAGADLFYQHGQRNLAALSDKALRLVDEARAGVRPLSDLGAGTEIQSMFQKVDDAMIGALEDRAARDFAFLQDPIANRLRFDLPNFKQTLADLASRDINSVGRPGAVAEGISKLTQELPDQFTAKDINLYLRRFGRTGYGKGDKGFLEQLGDADRAKMSRQLFAAMSKDVEDIATSGQPGHTLASALRGAKDSYAAGLAEIDNWQNGLFAKVVGNYGPESAGRIADNLRKLNPDELKSVMTVVGYRPDVANAVRANWIERAFNASQAKMISRAGGEATWFNGRTFADALGSPQQLEAMFGRTHRQVLSDLILLQRAVARMNSHTFSSSQLISGPSRLTSMAGMAITPTRWPELAKNLLVPAKISRILLDPKARAELEIIANASAPRQRAGAAISYLVGQEAADLPQQ
jgi:hypothetical protein